MYDVYLNQSQNVHLLNCIGLLLRPWSLLRRACNSKNDLGVSPKEAIVCFQLTVCGRIDETNEITNKAFISWTTSFKWRRSIDLNSLIDFSRCELWEIMRGRWTGVHQHFNVFLSAM